MDWLAVFLGGGLGSIARYGISKWMPPNSLGFPTATFLANACACLVLGFAWAYFSKHSDLSLHTKSLVLVGFCGGFSTFSTFSLETLRLMQEGKTLMAIAYVSLSILACIAILWGTQKVM